jgi:hypothetical protein
MASIDIKQAYYMVPIAREHRKFLKFWWRGTLFQFTVLPNGLACAPRLFTKLLKPVYSTLRNEGVHVVGYIDDSFIVARTQSACAAAAIKVATLLKDLGFVINEDKSIMTPSKTLEFLGYTFDSSTMRISLPADKVGKVRKTAQELLSARGLTIQRVAEALGLFVAYCEASDYGKLHYRALERDKIGALKNAFGIFSAPIRISPEGWEDVHWWLDHAKTTYKTIYRKVPQLTITSDASLLGWGPIFSTWKRAADGPRMSRLYT